MNGLVPIILTNTLKHKCTTGRSKASNVARNARAVSKSYYCANAERLDNKDCK